MTMNGDTSQTAVEVCPLGFVAVLSPNADSTAEETLRRILPDLAAGPYHWRSIPGLAMAVRDDNISISLTSGNERDVVLLGHVVSECVGPDDALPWAVSAVAEGRYGELKRLQGVFALIVVDWAKRTVTVVSDLLGIQPFYLARREGVTILSDRAEAAPRLGGASIDALGMAGWLYFGIPLANRTLFESVERIAPASVTVFDAQSSRQEKFWTPTVAEEPISADDLADGVYHDFVDSLRRLLRPYKAGTVLLSGGFDSRFCLLTSLRETNISVDAVTVPYTRAERRIANELVDLTGIDCRRVKIKGSIWDEFESMWYRHPDGFSRWRNLSYLCITRLGKSGPFIDGSHSDVALRRSRAGPTHGRLVSEPEARKYVWSVSTHHNVESYFRSGPVVRFEQLARQAADEQSDAVGWNSKFCRQWNIQTDERRNIAFNYLQYAGIARSIQPFYDRALMERRLRYPNEMFTKDSYRAMLKRHFPGQGELPHSDDLPKGKETNYAFSRTLWRQLPSIMQFIHRHRDVLNCHWILPRIGEYALGRRRHMYVVLELMRFVKLEEELNRFGIEVDLRKVLF